MNTIADKIRELDTIMTKSRENEFDLQRRFIGALDDVTKYAITKIKGLYQASSHTMEDLSMVEEESKNEIS
jgi:hypothetical protein